jgi:hypothetical protein
LCCSLSGLTIWAISSLTAIAGALSTEGGLADVIAGVSLQFFCGLGAVLIFVAIGVTILVWAGRPIVASWRVSHPEITLNKPEFRVGESIDVSFQQRFKRAAEVERMDFKLLLRETATYQRGTDTYTVRHEDVVEEHEFPSGHIASNRVVQQSFSWRIPRDGMHTFKANRNKIQWFLKVEVEIAGWPDYEQEYEVKVLPELASG